jgi:hypothetical protein
LLKSFDGTVAPPRFLRKNLYRAWGATARAAGVAFWLAMRERIDIAAFKP